MRVSVDGVDVFYEVVGEGTPVVALHGYEVDHRIMAGCLEPVFEPRGGYRRFYLDLPGMGQTPRSDGVQTSDDMLDLVQAVIEKLMGNAPFLVIGESYGGYLARGLTRRTPERILGLGLICPMIVAPREARELPEHRTLVLTPGLLDRLTADERAEFEPMAVVATARTWERFANEVLPGVKLADGDYLERIRATGYQFSFDPDDLPSPFERPALILTGRQDSSTGYRDAWKILERYPRATFAVLDCAGHNLQIEQERVFAALVSEWLDRCES